MIKTYLKDLFALLYPNVCMNCDVALVKGEELLCLRCYRDLPTTKYHLANPNPLMVHFSGINKVEGAFSFLKYEKKGMARLLLHPLKYNGHTHAGFKLGEWFASQLRRPISAASIDLIVPIPLHPKKQRKRGYNQSEIIAKGISSILAIPIDTSTLIRAKNVATQTRKGKVERWQNMESLYQLVDVDAFAGKRILLIDDVITTGATTGAAAELIAQTHVAAIFVACIATGKK